MNTKEKTAFISTALNLGLTCAKFFLFYFTGSIAILAEAWHSFSDIGTSILVYLAIRFQKKDEKESSRLTLEHFISLGIGIFLFVIALSVLYKVITSPRVSLQGTIVSGVFFLFFSVGSYFVYKFETSIGKEEKSSALISDGLHSKADMAAAFLTGISLILYRLGINIDKKIALLIALFILSFATESIVHFLNPQIRRNPQLISQYHSYKIIATIFDPEFISKILHSCDQLLGRPFSSRPHIKRAVKKYFWLAILIPFLCYASTCIVTIAPREEGIQLRFDRAINQGKPLQPGLHLKLPWPVEKVIKVNTQEIRQIHIGNISDNQSFALLWSKEHGTGEPFLSGDNNYLHPYLILHYRIKNIFNFKFLHKEPEQVLNSITHHIITHLFAINTFYDIATKFRSRLITEIQEQVQKEIDIMKVGIEIVSVNMKDTHPPIFIADSFEEVIAAFQEKKQMVNTAYGYQNQKLPEARGESARRIAKAEAYNAIKEFHAIGDASRFIAQLETWEKYPAINRIHLYLRGISDALQDKRLIIIDPKAGKPQMWMGFTEIPGFSDLIQGEGVK